MGITLVMLAAAVWPLPDHLRFRSLNSVQPDAGRVEEFLIRWPTDRVAQADAPDGIRVLEDTGGRRVSAELFRVRDTEGNVIGYASRLAANGAATPGASASSWMLVVPSRGALYLQQADVIDVTARATPAGARVLAGTAAFWSSRAAKFQVNRGAARSGKVLGGTSEFLGLQGSYGETWELDGTAADGTARGRIRLSTLTGRGP